MSQNQNHLPVPEPREVIGLTASFSGLAAMLVLVTVAPHPYQNANTSNAVEARVVVENIGAARAVGV